MTDFLYLFLSIAWIAGVVLAVGAWGKFLAIVIPFYAYYLVVEHIMSMYHMI